MKSPVLLLSSLFDDVKRLEPGIEGLDRDLVTVKTRFEHEGYGFLSVALSTLGHAVDYGLSTGCFTCPSSFSKVRMGALPKFLQGLLCKVFDVKTGLLLEEPSLSSVKLLREILFLFKKVQLKPKRQAMLERQAITEFFRCDTSILSHSYDSDKLYLFRKVANMVLANLDNFDESVLPCSHGPGGVAQVLRPNQKWSGLIDEFSKNPSRYSRYGLDLVACNGYFATDRCNPDVFSFEDMIWESDYINGIVPQRAYNGVAKLICVPKNSTSLRTITSEPVENQFIQQGLNRILRDHIKKNPIFRCCLALTDQSKNQKLAMEGSIKANFSTIDLSSASDLLSLDLVKQTFSGAHKFLTYAIDCRSTHVSSKFGTYKVEKFAGMGNALTFPIQSITFALLAICGVLCCEGRRPSFGNVKRAAMNVRVYGDDIIVRTEHSIQVCEWLTSFGLKVNQKKSFLRGNFKESCGVDAYKGINVTPLYLRHEPFIPAGNPEVLASLVSTSNLAWDRCLYSLSNTIRKIVEGAYKLPLVSKSSAALGWHSRVDTTIAHKWDRKLQRLVFRAYVVEPRKRDDRISDYAALYKSLNALELRGFINHPTQESNDHLERSVLRFNTKLRKRWVPALLAS